MDAAQRITRKIGHHYEMLADKYHELWPMVDQVYHSESWQDMWLKIDLLGLAVDTDVFMMLCETLCYHYGFWAHTKPRFMAFKKFLKLKRPNPLTKVKLQKKTLDAVRKKISELDIEMFINPVARVPGRMAELRAWQSIHLILEQCQDGKKRPSKKKSTER